MKTTRVLGAMLIASSVLLGACSNNDDNNVTGTSNNATVRFVNTTGQNIDIGTNGTYASGNSNLAFGAGSQCLSVNPSSSGLTFRQNGQTSTFTPTGFNASSMAAGGRYTVVLGGTSGAYTAQTYNDTYTGATASAGGVRVINAMTGGNSYGLYLGSAGSTMPSTAASSSFGSGMSTAFMPINVGNGQVWLTSGTGSSQTTAFSSASFPVTANGYQTVILANPATTGGPIRSFTTSGCTT